MYFVSNANHKVVKFHWVIWLDGKVAVNKSISFLFPVTFIQVKWTEKWKKVLSELGNLKMPMFLHYLSSGVYLP